MRLPLILAPIILLGFMCRSPRQKTVRHQRSDTLVTSGQHSKTDSLNNKEILDTLAKSLNLTVPQYKEVFPKGFYVNNQGKAVGFSVYDLVDTTNKEESFSEDIKFYNYHVYHFFPAIITYAYSNIAVVARSKIRIFKAVNCKGDNIDDVLKYIRNEFPDYVDRHLILQRVLNYRAYGRYLRTDEQSEFVCK